VSACEICHSLFRRRVRCRLAAKHRLLLWHWELLIERMSMKDQKCCFNGLFLFSFLFSISPPWVLCVLFQKLNMSCQLVFVSILILLLFILLLMLFDNLFCLVNFGPPSFFPFLRPNNTMTCNFYRWHYRWN